MIEQQAATSDRDLVTDRESLGRRIGRQFRRFTYAERIIRSGAAGRVCSGPFVGMNYVETSVGSAYYPKILGTYELELHAAVERIQTFGVRHIINIGAAEGYYAVGLARRIPGAKVVAFEGEARGRALTATLAALNGVSDYVEPRGWCTRETLSGALAEFRDAAVVIDAEGAEKQLLDPAATPALRTCVILVEVHDFIHRGLGEVLRRRFERSHAVEEIWSRPRTIGDFPLPLSRLAGRFLEEALAATMDEKRPEPMRWLLLWPNG
jgi:hypothetical protein